MSDYRSTSELMQLCAKAGGPPVPVSPELFYVLEKAVAVSRLSDGAFDVTVGPVVRLWRRCRRTQRLPEPDQLAAARALVGYQNIRLDAAKRTVQLLKPGMQLDLGGIAKGYTADEALKVLQAHGIDRALVAAGGDIAVSGPPPDQPRGWSIAIAPADESERNAPPTLFLHDGAVSTSGDAEQHVVIDGRRYSHIVDPRTGIGLTDPITATVVARRGIDADSLTKVVSVLGPERGLKILESLPNVSARALRRIAGGPQIFISRGFPHLEPAKHAP
jgi:thiamine biosynthesis lipoprotein